MTWLRNGLTIDCTRLIEEVGFRPRSTVEAVEDFVAELRGRRVAAGPRRWPRSRNGKAHARRRADPTGTPRSASARAGCASTASLQRPSRRTRSRAPDGPPARAERRARRSTSCALLRTRRARAPTCPARSRRAAVALPSRRATSRPCGAAPAGRLRAGRVGLRRGVVEIVYPLFELMYERWWRVRRGVENVPPMTARCSSPTTPACSRGTRR